MRKIIVFILLFGLAGILGYNAWENYSQDKYRQIQIEKKKAAWDYLRGRLEERVVNFNGQAGVVIKDLENDWAIEFNKNVLFPSASLVKIPILLSYFYAFEEGRINPAAKIKLKASYKVPGSKALGDLPAGYELTVEELLDYMITLSDNTATNILIDFLGKDSINNYFAKIGLNNTDLKRKMMDFEQRKMGVENYTSAADMAYLLERLYRRGFINKGVSKKCLDILTRQKVRDRIPRKLPPSLKVAHKTGLENHICHDAGIVFTEKGDFLICVLVRHQDKLSAAAKELIADLAMITYNHYQNLN